MAAPKSNEVLQANIEAIQSDIKEIKYKLDTKYVSHETFELTVRSILSQVEAHARDNEAKFALILKIAIVGVTPVYGAVIALLFKTFGA